MIAKRQAILNKILEVFDALDGVEEVDINASGDPSKFPALIINESDQGADEGTEPGATRYNLPLTIEGYIAGGTGREATAQRSALYLLVVNTMLAEPPLAGLAEEVNEGSMRLATAVLSQERRMGFALDFNISFVADRQSPVA